MIDKFTILVVDDEPINLAVIGESLNGIYTVLCTTNSADALELLNRASVDLILLDIMMPSMDGYEVCRAIKQNPKTRHIPILFITAKTDIESEIKGLSAGAADFIHKPASLPVLFARVEAHLALAQQQLHLEGLLIERTKDLAEARKAAENASQRKSEFISSMHHELKTPLTAILGFSQLIEVDGPAAATREYLAEIIRAGDKMVCLVNQMLDFSSIDNKLLLSSMEPCLIGELLDESIDLVEEMAAKRGVSIARNSASCDAERIMVDRARFRQVLVNLLSNAVKFNKDNGKVDISCEKRGDQLCFRIRDTGMGIPKSMHSRVFKPFDRLGREGGTIEGVGVGLASVKRIVEALGGRVSFVSEEGVGSCFEVHLSPPRHR